MKKITSILFVVLATTFFTVSREADCRPITSPSFTSQDYRQAEIAINHISLEGNRVQLVDGSHWEVPASDAHIVSNWRRGDILLISQNPYYFSSYTYALQNLSTQTCSLANLSIGPIVDSVYTHWIKGINFTTGQILLEDETVWKIYTGGSDGVEFSKWQVHDTIIIGANSAWFTWYKNVLINASQNFNTYVRAKPN